MSAAASWLSVSGLGKAEVLDRLGLAETSEPVPEGFFPRRDQICVSELPSGRILVLAADVTFFEPGPYPEVSLGCELVGGQIEEHVMYSSGWQCRDGALIWSAVVDPDEDDMAIKGTPPAAVSTAAKGGDDLFETPLRAVAEIGRFEVGTDLDGWTWDVTLVEDAMNVRRREQTKAELAARAAARAEKAAGWKASGGLVGAVRRMFGGR